MKKKLVTAQKFLCQIETKGTQTLLMADSLRLIEDCIQECKAQDESEKGTESVEG